MQRITLRDRPYERNMEPEYISQLNQAYEQFFGERYAGERSQASPVLVVDTNELDYTRKPEDLKWVENRIRQALKLTPFQTELPFQMENQARVTPG